MTPAARQGGRVENVLSDGALDNTTIVGASIVLLSVGAADTTTIAFISCGGTAAIGGSGLFGATLAGFAPGDTVALTALTFTSAIQATFGSLLSVWAGGGLAIDQIRFESALTSGAAWHLSSDWHGGTDITLVSAATQAFPILLGML